MKKLLLLVVALCLSLGMSQTFVYQARNDIQTLEPLDVYDDTTRSVFENIYEGLYGYRGAGEFEPLLATSYEVSDDGLTYTFHLRDGVTFHSGNPFSCPDVEYSIKRALVVGSWELLREPLLGVGPDANDVLAEDGTDAEFADYWAKLEQSVKCSDDKTVVIRTLEPDASLLAKLQSPSYVIVDSEWAKAGGMWDGTEATWRDWVGVDLSDQYLSDKTSGTGAYQLVSWEPGVRVVAEANPDYWGGVPQIETVIAQVVEDEDARIEALVAGDADEIDLDDTYSQFEGHPGVRVLDLAKDPSLWGSTIVYTIQLNEAIITGDNDLIGSGKLDGLGIPPDFFTDLNVRKCFAYAFDPEAYTEEVYNGEGERITMALVPDYPGYDPELPEYEFDLAKAGEYCRAAWGGQLWENGMYFAFPYVSDSPRGHAVARILKENLESLNANFAVDLRPTEWGPDWFPYFDEPLLPVNTIGTYATFPDSSAFIDAFYKSPDSFASFNGYKNEEMDRLIEEASTQMNEAKRAELYRQVGRLGYDDVPFILLPYGPDTVAISNKISGAHGKPIYSSYRWKDLSKAH